MKKKESMKLKKIIKSAALANLLLAANISSAQNRNDNTNKINIPDLVMLKNHLDTDLGVNDVCSNTGCNNTACA